MVCDWNIANSQLILKRLIIMLSLNQDRIVDHDFNIFFGIQLLQKQMKSILMSILLWKHHIIFVSKQITFKSVGIIFRSWFYLSSRTKQALYYSLSYP